MRLSVLDQSVIVSGRSPDASIRETLDLAKLCDSLGYHRFWLSEHHGSAAIAGTAPEVLLAALAVTTRRIRLGSAGVMLPHYSALKVAEQFRVLEALAPGRIDLGVGRAPGSDGRTALALNPNAANAAANFPAQLRDLMAWAGNTSLADGHPFASIAAQPTGPHTPEFWVLGSSTYGAQLAAYFGLPYGHAYFFNEGQGAAEALDLYRDSFHSSARHQAPYTAIAVFVLAADTQAEAELHYASREVWQTERERGRFLPLPSPGEVVAYAFTDAEQQRNAARRRRAIFGTKEIVAARLAALAASYRVDEVAVATAMHDPVARRRSFELLAEAFALTGDGLTLQAA